MKVLNINTEHLLTFAVSNIIEKHYEDVEVLTSWDAEEILELSKEHSFDLILLDIGISTLSTYKLMKILSEQQKEANVLIFSRAEYKPYVLKYISLGASGFLDQSSSEKDLLLAIKMIGSGQLFLSQDILMSIYNNQVNSKGNGTPFHKLSKRELEVFKLLIKGKRIKEISKIMEIHQSTTSTLKKRIMEKLNVKDLMKLKTIAMEYGY